MNIDKKYFNSDLLPPNLATLGVRRRDPNVDLETIWLSPYPVISSYVRLVELCPTLDEFGGGTRLNQGHTPGRITSGYRDQVLEGNITSPHLFAFALDIFIPDLADQIKYGSKASKIFKRVGIYPDRKIIHVDLAPDNWIKKYNKARFWICRRREHSSSQYRYFNSFEEVIENVGS